MTRNSWSVRVLRVLASALVLFGLLLVFVPAPVVNAATITVNDTGGGAGGSTCTLRNAITAANTNAIAGGCIAGTSGADTIVLPSGATITLTVVDNGSGTETNGLPIVTTEITINGNGATIQRAGATYFRILKVSTSGTLALNDVTISNGRNPDGGASAGGGGGGISNNGKLSVTNGTITGNRTGDGSSGGNGGGIASTSTLTVTNSTITGNTTGAGSSSVGGSGGGIYNSGTLAVVNSTINNNAIANGANGGFGGGIYNYSSSTMNLTGSTISNNLAGEGTAAGGGGGGIYNNLSVTANIANCTIGGNTAGNGGTGGGHGGGIYHGGGTLTITNSTFNGNTSGNGTTAGYGGAIYSASATVTVNLTNVTISGNNTGTATGGSGGGIHNEGTLNVTSCTIAGNTASWSGGGLFINGGAATLKNTIVANNTASSNANCTGTMTNGGNNLDSAATCGWSTTNSSQSNANPLLAALANNGGSTQTLALQTGSPAIDGVIYNAPNSSPTTDQRGYLRPFGARHDIGAFEFPVVVYYLRLPFISKSAP